MATWKKVLVSGSAIEVRNITASNLPLAESGGGSKLVVIDINTGHLAYTSSGAGGGGLFIDQGDFANTGDGNETSIYITGSVLQPSPDTAPTETRGASSTNTNYALVVSQSAYFSNHNVGHPNNLAWQSNLAGSIFNNYDANTDVSEILRTFAGLISSSNSALVASPTPNSTNFAGANVEPENKPSSIIASYWTNAYIPQDYTDETVTYLDTQGFNDGKGNAILSNVAVTKYSQSHDNFGIRLDSLPSPSTLFDAGPKDNAFTVFAMASQSFSDNQNDTVPDKTSTFTTESFFQTTQTGAGTINGVTVATIDTSNPTVIPPQYQEAKFTNFPLITDRRFKASGEDFTSISASGYYAYHDVKVGIATGSTDVADIIGGTFTAAANTDEAISTYFITPLNPSDIPDNSVTINTGTADMITAASRSLSGAPYLNAIYYRINNFTASGMFDPLFYGGSSNIGEITINDDIGITHTTNAAGLRSRAQGGTVNAYYQNIWTGNLNSQALSGATPLIGNKILFHDSFVIASTIDYKTNELEGSTPTDTGFDLTMTIRKYNDTTTNDSITKNYHTAGTFGQPAASGAMSVFMSNDGDNIAPDNQASTTAIEYFGGEGYRRPIEATTDLSNSNAWDSGSRLTLGNGGGLQVKPGFLVNPEASDHGYWYPTTGYSDSDYKWYLREFDTGATGTATNLILTFNSTADFVPLNITTSGKIGIGVLLEYQLNNLGGGLPKIYDTLEGIDGSNSDVSLGESTSNQYNPFSDTVDVVSDWGGVSSTSTELSFTLKAGAGQVINNTYSKVYLLVRYTGDPSNNLDYIQASTT